MRYCKGSSTLQERSWRSHPNPGGWKSCLSLQTPPPPETELHWSHLWQHDMKDEELKLNVGWWSCRTSTSVIRELQKCILATDQRTVRCGAVCVWTPQGAWNIVWKEKAEKDGEEWRIEEDAEWPALCHKANIYFSFPWTKKNLTAVKQRKLLWDIEAWRCEESPQRPSSLGELKGPHGGPGLLGLFCLFSRKAIIIIIISYITRAIFHNPHIF